MRFYVFAIPLYLIILIIYYLNGLGIDGRDDMKLICGIKIAGMSLKTRKGDKVYFFLIFLFFYYPSLFKILEKGLLIFFFLNIVIEISTLMMVVGLIQIEVQYI